MRKVSVLLLLASIVQAADVITVDATSQVIVAGAAPSTPATTEVRIGGGNVLIGRTTAAGTQEAVRGDDPRLTNARPASGGDAATVGGNAPSAFVSAAARGAANGVAPLDGTGMVPAAFLPVQAPSRGMQVFTSNGTFTVPNGVTQIQVILLGGGGAGGYANANTTSGGGNAGGFAWVTLTGLQPSYAVTIGSGGAAYGGSGGTSSFGSAVVCTGGGGGGSSGAASGALGTATSSGSGLLASGASGVNYYLYGTGAKNMNCLGGMAMMFGPNYGSGGTSATSLVPITSSANGTPGICIVTW